jgi:hypothetical protein
MKVKLYEKSGALVHEAEIPFDDPPDVVYWGRDAFVVPRTDGDVGRRAAGDHDGAQVYERASVYGLPSWPGVADPDVGGR